MKTISVKIEVKGNTISFSNTYLNRNLRSNLSYDEDKFRLKIRSNSHPELHVEMNESDKIHLIKVFMRGDRQVEDDNISSVNLRSENQVTEVVGKILLSLAKYDMTYVFTKEEEKESILIMNGITVKMDTSKQLDMARYLLGGAV